MRKIISTAKTTAIILFVLMVLTTISTILVEAQTTLPQGVTPTNVQSSGSLLLPSGVTADVTLESIAHMSFRPNPVGVGQPILFNLWMQPPLHGSRYFKGYTVTFTKPDGTKDTKVVDSYQADASAWFEYAVDQVGTWKIKFEFPGGYFPAGNYTAAPGAFVGYGPFNFQQSVYYKPSSDGPYDLIVQQNMVASWPPAALPTDYWTRPVSPDNREWWPILGNYPATGIVGGGSNWPAETNAYMSNYLFTPYVQAPNTAHVVWKQQGSDGGLIGGTLQQVSYPGSVGTPRMIYAGRCYDTITKTIDGKVQNVWRCYDLRTGEVYWEQTGNSQVPQYISYVSQQFEAVPGASAYLRGMIVELIYVGGGRYIRYNPYTGAATVNISVAPITTGTFYMDPYFLTVQNLGTGKGYRLINWTVTGTPSGTSLSDFALTIMNNITWPFSSLGTCDFEAGVAVTTQSVSPPATGVPTDVYVIAASLTTGQMLWNVSAGIGYGLFSGSTSVADHGKFAVRFNDGLWHCWDLASGKKLWQSELSTWPWGTFGCYGTASYGGMIIANQYDGVAAYDWDNGKLVWLYQAKAEFPYETPYQDNYPYFTGVTVIADGKIYTYNTEHTPSQPEIRGWKMHCINATTGDKVWTISGSMSPGAVADGYLTAANGYDGYMYVFGKGKSKTTVDGLSLVVPKGQGIVIQGTVLDQSPAQPDTPCVSVDSMTTQMEYLHMQLPIDGIHHNATVIGVPVTLTALSSDGSSVNIGTITTDGYYGTFSKSWTPNKEGDYKIIASFAGDDSYGSSAATTTISVGPAPASTDTGNQQQITVPDYTMLILGGIITIIIAVAIVGALLFVTLRRR